MTVTEILNKLADRISPINHVARVNLDGLTIHVKVLDARKVWNRIDVLVTPFTGEGQKWIDASRLQGYKVERRINE